MKGLLSKLGLCKISLMEKGSLKERVFGEVNVFVSSILAKLWCRYQVGKASCSVANREEVINRIWPGDQWKSSLGHVLDLKWHFENFHLNFITKYLLKDSNIATSTFSCLFKEYFYFSISTVYSNCAVRNKTKPFWYHIVLNWAQRTLLEHTQENFNLKYCKRDRDTPYNVICTDH